MAARGLEVGIARLYRGAGRSRHTLAEKCKLFSMALVSASVETEL